MIHAQVQRVSNPYRASGTVSAFILIVTLFVLAGCSSAIGVTASSGSATSSGDWKLVWSDEFAGANGSVADAGKWEYETGGNGWGNNELEYYTKRSQNAAQVDGNLVITALRENYTGPDNISREFTSARLKTAGKFSQKYGRFEARMKLPSTQGMWPAFWMLGDNVGQVNWPACGEIDIMELVGSAPSTVLGTLHGPGYSGEHGISKQLTLADGKRFSDDFHVFAVEWEPNVIRFYVDQTLLASRTPADLPEGKQWVFDHPFFIILNLAIGGNLPGPPDATTVLPQKMVIDYVRVYAR
jgi:beta-glucanase (GH16 family)